MPPHQNPSQFTNIKIQSYIHHTITEWVKPKHKIFTTSAWGKPGQGKHDTDKVPGRPTLLKIPNPPPLKFPLVMIKSSVLKKLLHSLIPSLQTSFIPSTCGNFVLYITKNPRKSWSESHSRIHSFVPPGLINLSTSCSTNLHITKTYIMCGQTYAYPPTNPYVTARGYSEKSNTNLYKVI